MNALSRGKYSEASGYSKILILLGLFVLGFAITGTIITSVPALMEFNRESLSITAVLQDIFTFIFPALAAAWLFSARPAEYLATRNKSCATGYLLVLLLYIVMIPGINQIVWWNEHISLPASMKGIEDLFRQFESDALRTTEMMLSARSAGGFVIELLIIGILAPVSEELFFRGALQRTLASCTRLSATAAIWISAIVFSAIHFQFYGFFARMLLGAFYGYLLVYSGSLWLPIMAHALNNSVVVILKYISVVAPEHAISQDPGVVTDGFPFPALVSVLLFGIIMYAAKKKSLFRPKGQAKENV